MVQVGSDGAPPLGVIDALGHDDIARMVVGHTAALPIGSVTAIQASWGRGKTDVLRRAFENYASLAKTDAEGPLWLNPWRYGTPDLLTPLVKALVPRLSTSERHSPRVRAIVRSLLKAANATLFKSASVIVPVQGLVQRWEDIGDELIDELLSTPTEDAADPDPIAAMSDRFRELVASVLEESAVPLAVCIDDIDRCLPAYQVAILESLHFLTSAGARCVFFVAIDPELVKEAASTHYGTRNFDTERYLDKLFDLRVQLPGLLSTDAANLARALLERTSVASGELFSHAIAEGLGVTTEQLVVVFTESLFLPSLRNPRFVDRLVTRLYLLALARRALGEPHLDPTDLLPLVQWSALTLRFPTVRHLFQNLNTDPSEEGVSEWSGNLYGLQIALATDRPYWERVTPDNIWTERIADARKSLATIFTMIPDTPELGNLLTSYGEPGEASAKLQRADSILKRAGL